MKSCSISFRRIITSFAVLSILAVCENCKVGLGESIDTEKPTVSIESPQTSSILSGEIEIRGTCKDDKSVSKVLIQAVYDIKNEKTLYENLPAELKDDNTWTITLLTNASERAAESGARVLPDGSYKVIVIAIDSVGRQSEEYPVSFEVDSTPPIVALSKPNSLDMSKPATYGRTVKITGAVSDSHNVPEISIRVFRQDGSEIQLTKSTFEGVFDSDTSLVIAQYLSEKEVESLKSTENYEESEEYQLYRNYIDIYGDTSSETFNTEQKYYAVITGIDTSGNSSQRAYIKSKLLKLTKEAADISDVSELRKILDGSTSIGLSSGEKAAVISILNGTYSADGYIADEKDRLVFSINSKANPKYQVLNSIYEVTEGGGVFQNHAYKETGSLTLKVTSGLDDAAIYPNSISGKIIRLNEDLTDPREKDGENAGLVIENGKDVTAQYVFEFDGKYIKDSSDNPIDDNDTTVTDATYVITLSDIQDAWKDEEGNELFLSANHYRIEFTGEDENENELIAANDAEYGFFLETSSSAAKSSFKDNGKYVKASDFAEDGRITINVSDDDSQSKIKATVSAVYFDTVRSSFNDADFEDGSAVQIYSEDLTGSTSYTLEADTKFGSYFKGLSEASAANYTIAFRVLLEKTGANSSLDTYYLYADDKAPVIELENAELKRWEESGRTGNIVITEKTLSEGENYYMYTVNGTWSDEEGSETNKIMYLYENNAPENYAPSKEDEGWLEVDEIGAPVTQEKRKLSSDFELIHGEGKNKAISYYATDKAGNETDIVTYRNIIFDFGVPSLTNSSVKTYYKNADNAEITFTGEDSNEITGISVSVSKDGESIPETEFEKNGITVTEFEVEAENSKKGSLSVRLTTDGSQDGKYTIRAYATDIAGRKSDTTELTTTVDGTAPEFNKNLTINGENYSGSLFFNQTGLELAASYTDETSKIKNVYYYVQSPEKEGLGDIADLGSVAGRKSYTLTESDAENSFDFIVGDFRENTVSAPNVLYIQAVDKAGNLSKIEQFTINVDSTVPTVQAQMPSYINGTEGNSVVLTANDSLRVEGISVEIFKGGEEIPQAEYEDYGISVTKGEASADGKKLPLTIEFTPDGGNSKYEGEYSITARSTDAAGNTSISYSYTTIVDGTAPEFTASSLKINSRVLSENPDYFFDSTGLTVTGEFMDAVSGLYNVYYLVRTAQEAGSRPQSLVEAGSYDSVVSQFTNGKGFSINSTKFEEGSGTSRSVIYIQAEDKAGNLSEVEEFSINIDTQAPTVTAGTYKEFYRNGEEAVLSITAKDSNLIEDIIFSIKKNGEKILDSSENGQSDFEFYGITVTKENAVRDGSDSKMDARLTFNTDGSADGKYEVTVKAVDVAGRESSNNVIMEMTVDGTEPEFIADMFSINGSLWQSGTYYKSTTLNVSGEYAETTSGIKYVYYLVDYTGRGFSTPSDLTAFDMSAEGNSDGKITVSSGSNSFSSTIESFLENQGTKASTIYLQAEDAAGNLSRAVSRVINIDLASPQVIYSALEPYYNSASANPMLLVTAKDSNQVTNLVLTVSKNGTVLSEEEYAQNGITVTAGEEERDSDGNSTRTDTVTFTVDGNHDGAYTVYATVTDAAGKTTTNSQSITIDCQAPLLTQNPQVGTKPLGAEVFFNEKTLRITGKYEDEASGLAYMYYKLVPSTQTETVNITDLTGENAHDREITFSGKSGNFDITLTDLTDNKNGKPNYLYIQAVDAAGNKTDAVPFVLNVDATAPSITKSPLNANAYYKKGDEAKFTFTAVDDIKIASTTVQITKDNLQQDADGDKIKIERTLSEDEKTLVTTVTIKTDGNTNGSYVVNATSKDAGGNSNQASFEFTIDGTAPEFTAGSLKVGSDSFNQDAYYPNTTMSISGEFTDTGVGMDTVYYWLAYPGREENVPTDLSKVYDESSSFSGKSFTIRPTSFKDNIGTVDESGTVANILYIQAKDIAGNLSEIQNFTFNVDTAAPSISSGEVKAYYKGEEEARIVFTGTDANKINDIEVHIYAVNANGTADTVAMTSAQIEAKGISVQKSNVERADDGNSKMTATVSFSSDSEKDGRFKVTAQAKDIANKASSLSEQSLVIDRAAPVFTTGSLKAGGEAWSDESYYEQKNMLISGAFSDNLSNVKYVYYYVKPAAGEGSSTVPAKETMKSLKQGTVSSFETANNFEFTAKNFSEDKGEAANTLYIQAEDAAGNLSEISEFKFNIDMAAPVLSVGGYRTYYTSGSNPVLEFTSTDSNKVKEIEFTISKGGAEVSSGTNGITVDNATAINEINDISTATRKVTFTADGTHDGVYTVSAKSKDILERESNTITIEITVDCVKPVMNGGLKSGNAEITQDTYFRSSTQRFTGSYNEATSGMATVYYWLSYPGRTASVPGDLTADSAYDGKIEYTTSSSGAFDLILDTLKDNIVENGEVTANILYVQAIDKAGNKSDVKQFTINMDSKAPVVGKADAAAYYKKDAASAEIKIVSTDGQKFAAETEATLTITKNGQEIGAENYSTNYITVSNVVSADGKTLTTTISIPRDGSADGEYTVSTSVADAAGNNASGNPVTFIVDGTAPEFTENSLKVGNQALSTGFYKNNVQKISGTYTDAETGSGMETLYYYVKNPSATSDAPTDLSAGGTGIGEASFKGNDFSFTLEDLSNNQNGNGSTVYIQAKDAAGNTSAVKQFTMNVDTTAPELAAMFYKVGDGSIKAAGGTAYANGSAAITVYGNYSDEQSGVGELTFTYGASSLTPASVLYSSSSIADTATDSAINGISFSEFSTFADKKTIKSWKAVFTPTTGGKFSLAGSNGAEAASTESPFSITIDNTAPKTNNIRLLVDADADKDAYKKTVGDAEQYYINNITSTSLTISGVATDNIGVEGVTLEITDSGSNTHTYFNSGTSSEWKFSGINMSGWGTISGSADAVAKITVTDVAGNSSEASLNINFDTAAPSGYHEVDSSSKDLYFRIGENDNDDINKTDSLWNTALDTDVGGKYSEGTYGNASTIRIRGKIDDSGSGVNLIYYYVFDKPIDINSSYNEVSTETTKTELSSVTLKGKEYYKFKSNENLRDWVKANKTGYFAPLSAVESKRVFYNVSADGETYSGTQFTTVANDKGYFKYYKNVESNYDATLSGFDSTKNYLVLVAVDNVGNVGLDTSSVGNETKYFCQLNVDTVVPAIDSDEKSKFTNGSQDVTITGTVSDEASGVKSVSIEMNELVGGITVSFTGNAGMKNGTDWSDGWTVTIPASNFPSGVSGNVTVYATATDNAGQGNSKTISVANVTIDQTGPSISVNDIIDADTSTADAVEINGTVSISGTASDENGVQEAVGLYYQTVASDAVAPEKPDDNSNTSESTWKWKTASATRSGTATNWTFEINTSSLNGVDTIEDGSRVYFTVAVQDKAGNIGYSEPVEVIVDQNTDRPKVTFSNITLGSEMTASSYIWLKNTTKIIGTVSDDDGVADMKISLDGSEWKNATLTGSAFSYDLQDFYDENKENQANGSKTIYFRITDKAGKTFTSGTSNSTSAVYITDGTDIYGGTGHVASILYVTVDTLYPEVILKGAKLASSTEYSTAYTSIKLGGTENTAFDVKFSARDTNGIDTGTISGTAEFVYGSNEEQKVSVSGNSSTPDGEGNYILRFELTDEDKQKLTAGSGYDGNISLRVSASDMAGNASSQTATLSYDFAASAVTFGSPASNTTLSGDVTAYGSLTETAKIWYAVTPDADAVPNEKGFETSKVSSWTDGDGNTTEFTPKPTADEWKAIVDGEDSSISWTINFDSSSESSVLGTVHAKSLNKYLIDYGIADKDESSSAADSIVSTFNDFVKLYLWIKTEDSAGNITTAIHQMLVDPQGDRPNLQFSYPAQSGGTLGGTVSIYGTATDTKGLNPGIDTVWVQIKSTTHRVAEDTSTYGDSPSYDESEDSVSMTLTKADLDYMADNGYNVYKMSTYSVSGSNTAWTSGSSLASDESAGDYAALATSSGAAWNIQINKTAGSNGLYEFDPPSGISSNPVAIRVFARDYDGKFSLKSDRFISFDADTPVISDLYLVQSSDKKIATETTASKAYTKDMYVKDSWYLTGTATDKDKIAVLKIGDTTLLENKEVKSDYSDCVTISHDGTTVKFKYPLSTGEGVGSLDFIVSATDAASGTPHTGTESISIKYDNQKPEPALTAADGLNINSTIQQNNSWYTFGSKVTELPADNGTAQSGFAYTAFYFTRDNTVGSTKTLYDVLKSRNNAAINITGDKFYAGDDTTGTKIVNLGEETSTDDNSIVTDSGLYWYRKKISNISGGTFEVDDATGIRVNALMKIDGALYLITAVNGNSITVATALPETVTVAYVAIAAIVDNTTPEGSGTEIQSDGYYESPSRDDGDRMIESVDKSGTTWAWEASICSRNISDGPVTLHYVVFDKAGNYTEKSVNGTVSNNRPRIAGAIVKTDYNGDGDVNDDGETIDNYSAAKSYAEYYTGTSSSDSYIYDPDERVVNTAAKNPLPTSVTYGESSSPLAALRGYTLIQPEIVGGNGALYYSYSVTNGGNTTTGNNSTAFIENGSTDYTAVTGSINVQLGDLIKFGDSSEGIPFEFTFWDETEGTTKFNNSQNAVLTMYFAIQAAAVGTPSAFIKPFYWNSSSDNSIYKNSTANGHIELEDDWKEADGYSESATAGEFDGDPKVSGKITIEGTASDTKLINTLTASIFGKSYDVAEYSSPTGLLASAYAETGFEENGFWFEIIDQTVGSTGHFVTWKLHIDTAMLSTINSELGSVVAKTDLAVTMTATNFGKPSTSTDGGTLTGIDGTTKYSTTLSYTGAASSNPGTTQTTSSDNAPYYRMDVVPYITGIETSLSSIKKKNPSVYSRSALGHYSVRSDETVSFSGFNLGTNTSLAISTLTTSGSYNLTVNGIDALNNWNNNNARGSYGTKISDASTYTEKSTYAYNRQPNGDNNNLLTDDIYFDVWEFDSDAVVPISGKIEQPHMAIDPVTGQIGFAFVNGPLYFSLAGSTESGKKTSYDYWSASFDFFTSVGFAYDTLGHTYGVAAGGDINSGEADKFIFMSDRFGRALNGTGTDRRYSTYYGTNSYRLESIGMTGSKTNTDDTTIYFDKQRIKSPSIVTTVHDESTTNVYMAYYDAMNNEIRFKAGNSATFNDNEFTPGDVKKYVVIQNVTAGDVNFNGTNNIFCNVYYNPNLTNGDIVRPYKSDKTTPYNDYYYTVAGVGNSGGKYWFKLQRNGNDITYTEWYSGVGSYLGVCDTNATNNSFQDFDTTNAPPAYRHGTVSLLAGNGTSYGAGSYVSLGVVPGTTATTDVVVAVWYDEDNRQLLYSYNDSPLTNRNGTTDRSGWSKPVAIFDGTDYDTAGEYCQIAVDANGGIHIAAYDGSNCDLVYAYLSSYNATAKTCIVDSNGVVGSNITIDVALNNSTEKKAIPRIGYYATSCIRPKLAYLYDTTSAAPDGSVDDEFTGKWECTVVPTSSSVNMQSNQYNKMNVGIWKNSDTGVVKKSTNGTSSYSNTPSSYSSTSYGFVYGNGTANAVMGYAIKVSSSSDAIETAQMK